MTISRYGSLFWAVQVDEKSILICVCVYKKGAMEVVRRLSLLATPSSPESQ